LESLRDSRKEENARRILRICARLFFKKQSHPPP
jgi:hypothetical protein